MAYFPFFIDISDKRILTVGGGKVALRKVEKLLPFGAKITVIAPGVCAELKNINGLDIYERRFRDSDLKGVFAVIAATDDRELNAYISQLCRGRGIHINSVDDPENCTFIFPALVKRENITIGISTGGASPIFARYLRERAEELLDDRMMETADIMAKNRPVIAAKYHTAEERKAAAEQLLEQCLDKHLAAYREE